MQSSVTLSRRDMGVNIFSGTFGGRSSEGRMSDWNFRAALVRLAVWVSTRAFEGAVSTVFALTFTYFITR